LDTSDKFGSLFLSLDKQKDTLNIDNYGIAITTMDEVFLEVAKDVELRKLKADLPKGAELPPSSESDEDDYMDEEPVIPKKTDKRRRSSVFKKNFKRQPTTNAVER
jgi:hypothetical protein